MTSQVTDQVYTPQAIKRAMELFDDFDMDALQAEQSLQGVVDDGAKTAAIILSGGTGERFGREGGKQLVEIAGKPIMTRSAEVMDSVGDIGLIVIVCPEDRQEEYLRRAIDPFPFATPILLAPAGAIRQESAFSGLEMVPPEFEYVLMHDGARPLISKQLVEHAISTLKGTFDADGVVIGHPCVDTLKVVEDGAVVGTPDRSVFWNAQTPQIFRTGILRRAHAAALNDGFVGTDDSSLIERLGGRVLMVEGKRDNIKITVPEDYLIVSAAIRAAYEQQREGLL